MSFPIARFVRPAKVQRKRRLISAFDSRLNILLNVLTEHHLEFLSLKGGCLGSCESALGKMPHCWKSHVADDT